MKASGEIKAWAKAASELLDDACETVGKSAREEGWAYLVTCAAATLLVAYIVLEWPRLTIMAGLVTCLAHKVKDKKDKSEDGENTQGD